MSMYPIIGYLGFGVIVIRVHVLGKYMIIRHLCQVGSRPLYTCKGHALGI